MTKFKLVSNKIVSFSFKHIKSFTLYDFILDL